MKTHECKESRTCTCYILETEPDEDCPVHGCPYPKRCEICGRFLPLGLQEDEDKTTC